MADIYEALHKDHEHLKSMLTAPDKPVSQLLDDVSKDLAASLEAEDTVLYAHLEGRDEVDALVTEARARQREVRTLSLELLEDIGSKEHSAVLVQRLREAVFHHIDEEERDLFEAARKVLSDEQAVALGAEFDRQKLRVEGRLAGARPY